MSNNKNLALLIRAQVAMIVAGAVFYLGFAQSLVRSARLFSLLADAAAFCRPPTARRTKPIDVAELARNWSTSSTCECHRRADSIYSSSTSWRRAYFYAATGRPTYANALIHAGAIALQVKTSGTILRPKSTDPSRRAASLSEQRVGQTGRKTIPTGMMQAVARHESLTTVWPCSRQLNARRARRIGWQQSTQRDWKAR